LGFVARDLYSLLKGSIKIKATHKGKKKNTGRSHKRRKKRRRDKGPLKGKEELDIHKKNYSSTKVRGESAVTILNKRKVQYARVISTQNDVQHPQRGVSQQGKRKGMGTG